MRRFLGSLPLTIAEIPPERLATRKPAAKKREREISFKPEISRTVMFTTLCVESQTAAVRMFLCFFGFGVLALEVGEGHVQ